MKIFLEKLLFLTYANKEEIECSDLLDDAISDFLRLKDEMDIETFYGVKSFLEYMSKKRGLSVDSFDAVEKDITTIDEVITKLQIPRMSFAGSKLVKVERIYTSESELYDVLRRVLLNQDGVRVFHKKNLHSCALIIARMVMDEMDKYELEETVDLAQFRTLLKMIISEYSKNEDENLIQENQEWLFNNTSIIRELVRKH